MEPFIKPYLFYLINISYCLKDFCIWTCVACSTITFIAGILLIGEDELSKVQRENIRKWFKKFFILSIFLGIFAILIPSEKICYQMLIASLVTPDNLKVAGQTAQDIIDYIIQAAAALIGQ
jgi:cell division septal protein FtsQ